jgi:AraC family transcriptional regulator
MPVDLVIQESRISMSAVFGTIACCGHPYNSLSRNVLSHPILLKLSSSCWGCEILTGLKPMENHETSTLDFTNQQAAARVLPQTPLIDSYHTGWKGLTFTHYCHPPHETVEHCLIQHSLVIAHSKSCFTAGRYLDGKFKHYAHGNGRVDIIPAFLSHRTNWDREVEFSVIAICPTLLVGVASPLENRATQESMQREVELIPQLAIEDPVIQQLALALKTEIQTGCMSGRLYGELLGTALAARLVQNYAVGKPVLEFKANGLSRSQLARVIDYMQANLTQDLSILDLATLTSMSESHFSRSFKRSVGISPYQYLMQQRVERAKQLLAQQSLALAKPLPQQKPPGTGIAISTIALDCGFANQTHLTKVFRQMTGMTPKAYQKR